MANKILLNNFCAFNNQEWATVPFEDSIMLINNYTLDQFMYQKINSNSCHLWQIYKTRAQYTIPNTPQVILAEQQSDNFVIQMFVQSAPFQLERLIKKKSCEATIQELMTKILKVVQFLVKKYGFFRITKDMIKVTRSYNTIVWINKNFNLAHRQYPLNSSNIYEDFKVMIKDFLHIFESAACKKQIKLIRDKIQSDKLLTFQKFKNILENQLKCQKKKNVYSPKLYKSPQFIKIRNSPHSSKRTQTQSFQKDKRSQQKFTPPINLRCPSLLSSVNISKNQNTNKQQIGQKNLLCLNKSNYQNYSSGHLKVSNQNQKKNSVQKYPTHKKCTHSENTSLKKKKFRESGNSISTAPFINSISSSGKLKMNIDEHNFFLTPKSTDKNNLVFSVGNKQVRQIKQTFKVKQSKIIEQKNQQMGLNTLRSFIKGDMDFQGLKKSEMFNEFGCILKSQCSSDYKRSSRLLELENQMFNILQC